MDQRIELWLKEKERIEMGGGVEAINKQHSKGKLTVRERMNYLFDAGTFQELGMFVKHRCPDLDAQGRYLPADAVVIGYGLINGRPAYAYGNDYTVNGGSLGEMGSFKMSKTVRMALQSGCPLIALYDSVGGRIEEGMATLNFGEVFYYNAQASGYVPQITAIMGTCAGGAAYSPAIMDFIFMVNGTGQMYLTGPKVIKQVMGEDITLQELGGAQVQSTKSGVSHLVAQDDYDCLNQIRNLLSYLPQNAGEKPPAYLCTDDPDRLCPELDSIIPQESKRSYDVKDVIRAIVDDGVFVEPSAGWAKNVVTAFARMNGKTVGIVAAQPKVKAGCMDMDSSDKSARFIRICDSYGIPLIYLCDVPGFLPGVGQEHGGIIRHGSKVVFANNEATVPKIMVVLRKMYGGGSMAYCPWPLRNDFTFYWPSGESGVVGVESAVAVLYGKKLASVPEGAQRDALYKELVEPFEKRSLGPYAIMENFDADEIIRPSETRKVLCRALQLLENKKVQPLCIKKHGNIPL